MKTLAELIKNVDVVQIAGTTAVSINELAFDSRKVHEGTLFIAVKGTQNDGHDYIQDVIASGVHAVICERLPENRHSNITFVVVRDSAHALALVADAFYDHPSGKFK